jgi:acrylyl-CoA reductase (NADPH)
MAQGLDFPASVAPFILRGVALFGINSVTRPKPQRIEAWDRLAKLLTESELEEIASTIGLGDVAKSAEELIAGKVRGRVLVDVNR